MLNIAFKSLTWPLFATVTEANRQIAADTRGIQKALQVDMLN